MRQSPKSLQESKLEVSFSGEEGYELFCGRLCTKIFHGSHVIRDIDSLHFFVLLSKFQNNDLQIINNSIVFTVTQIRKLAYVALLNMQAGHIIKSWINSRVFCRGGGGGCALLFRLGFGVHVFIAVTCQTFFVNFFYFFTMIGKFLENYTTNY